MQLLSLHKSFISHCATALLLIDLVIAFWIDAEFAHLGRALESFRQFCSLMIFLLRALHLARNNECRAGLINQDFVHLINHTVMALTLYKLSDVIGHVVAEVLETKCRIGGVGAITFIVTAPSDRIHILLDQTR